MMMLLILVLAVDTDAVVVATKIIFYFLKNKLRKTLLINSNVI